MARRLVASALLGWALIASSVANSAPPVEWDGLQRVPSKRFDLVYLQPGANFRNYTKVMIQPTEVAFRKNWRRDYNSGTRDLGGRVSDRDVEEAVAKGVQAATDIFRNTWSKRGYAVVDSPGPDVLKVTTGVLNISVSAPDVRTSARSRTFANEAGHATFFVELRDSMTGALLGRAVDSKVAGDNTAGWRTSVSNRSDFRQIVEEWAEDSVRGLTALKNASSGQ